MDAELKNTESMRFRFWICAGLFVLASITASWGTWEKSLGNHEAYVGVTAREMLEDGSVGGWVVPTFNGEVRLQKTPLNYWLTALFAGISGKMNEFVVRLPSIVLGVGSVMAVLWFVSLWLDFRTGALSAGVWATSLGFVRYTQTGRPEMALTAFITVAMLGFYTAVKVKDSDRRGQVLYMLIFWACFGFAMLAKGPAPLPLAGIVVLLYLLVFRDVKKIPKMLPVAGVLVFLLIFVPWPLLIIRHMPGALEFWHREFIERGTGEFAAGDKPFYYYFYVMFTLMAPWCAFVVLGAASPFYKIWAKKRDVMWYCWIWFAGMIGIMTLMGGKRQHYILPAMPGMAILIGIILNDLLFERRAYDGKFAKNFFGAHGILGIAGAAGATVYAKMDMGDDFFRVAVLAGGVTVFIALVWFLYFRGKMNAAVILIFSGIGLLTAGGISLVANPEDTNYYSEQFAREVKKEFGERDLAAFRHAAGEFIFYYGEPVPMIHEVDKLYEYYSKGWVVFAVGRYAEELKDDGRFERVYTVEEAEHRQRGMQDAVFFAKGGEQD
jgi:4-amino-4-deoxy-L-arabinose transferase-like glycosyltransferase